MRGVLREESEIMIGVLPEGRGDIAHVGGPNRGSCLRGRLGCVCTRRWALLQEGSAVVAISGQGKGLHATKECLDIW